MEWEGEAVQQEATPAGDREGLEMALGMLQGAPVVDVSGAELGDVEEVFVDIASGRITRVLLLAGNWYDSRAVSLPWEVLRWDTAGGCLIYRGTAADLVAEEDIADS